MRPINHVAAILTVSTGLCVQAQEIFQSPFWANYTYWPSYSNPPVAAVSIWSGGNESSIADAPGTNNSFLLVESALGQLTPQTIGYPSAAADLAASALLAANNAQAYRYALIPPGFIATANPASVWRIVFPGGFDPVSGSGYSANPGGVNYDTNLINQADYDLRARLQVNPCDTDAAQQLVLLQEARMLPWEWCGTEALAYAAYARLLQTNSEVQAIGQARGFYRSACDVLSQFLANSSDAALVEGSTPCLSVSVSNQVAEVLDVYLRNLAGLAEASLRYFQIQSLQQFYDASQQQAVLPPATQALLGDIDQTYSEIQTRLLLAAPFQNLPFYTLSAAGQVQSLSGLISRMHESIMLGRITFVAGANGTNCVGPNYSDGDKAFGEYTSSLIPFFNSSLTGGGTISSFNVALNLATTFVGWAASQEAAASNAVFGATQRAFDYSSAQADLQNQYFNQLVTLCGYTTNFANTNYIPDIFFAALPPGMRETTGAQILTNYSLLNQGSIYGQWLALQSAETSLSAATLQLSNIFSTMFTKQQVAQAIYNNYVNLAALILTNGQQIALLDIEKGDIQAKADLAIAQIEQAAAQAQAGCDTFDTVLSVAGSAVAAYMTGGLGAALLVAGSTELDSLLSAGGAYDQSSSYLTIGQIEANTARALAQIDAQIQRITSAEQAQAQYVNADNTMLNLSADLDALRLQAESQKMQVQLAAQNVDQERNKLAVLLAQVAYLLRQYGSSANLLAQNPQYATNVLLAARNAAIQRADDSFALAQQWAFLTAQCYYYEDNCAGDSTNKSYLKAILGARNTYTLKANLNYMQSGDVYLGASCQGSLTTNSQQVLSLRNDIIQRNTTSSNVYEPVLISGVVGTNAAASLAAWTNFLAQNISLAPGSSQRILRIPFRTSVNPLYVNGVPSNPFFDRHTFGLVISSDGIQVNFITATNLLLSGTVPVALEQAGTSTIRSLGYCNANNILRCFNFDPFLNDFSATINEFNQPNSGSTAFTERSVANDLWILELDENSGNPSQTILNNLDKLLDIQVRFGYRFYSDCQ
jgi:hypothetical protein